MPCSPKPAGLPPTQHKNPGIGLHVSFEFSFPFPTTAARFAWPFKSKYNETGVFNCFLYEYEVVSEL